MSIHSVLYIGWRKDGHIDGSCLQSFECKKIHCELAKLNLYNEDFCAELLDL